MSHKYSIGQQVHAAGAHFADRTTGIYEVIRLMPHSNSEFGYRIKNTASGMERAATESQIRAVDTRGRVQAPTATYR